MPITSRKIRNHFHYSFWKYLLLIAIVFFGWNLIYTTTRYRSPDTLKVEFMAQGAYMQATSREKAETLLKIITVKSFERQRHEGSEKIPPCWKAVMDIEISDGEQTATIKQNMYLHSRQEWKLCAFFLSIGLRKKGEPLKMNWPAVTGAHGRCKVGIRQWIGNDGSSRDSNQIAEFLEPVDTSFTPGKF